MENTLIEGIDYYINAEGLFVFTEKYLLERGYCCENNCKHCPYKGTEKSEPQQKNIN